MVFIRRNVDPALKQAKINVSLSTSPTLSLSDPDARLEVKLSSSIAWARPGRENTPLTFCVESSVFEVTDPDEGGMDIFAKGAFGRLREVDDSSKHISLGLFRFHRFHNIDSPDMRERGDRFVTVPGIVTHELTWERIFRYEQKVTKADLAPGMKFKIAISKVQNQVGTYWWCWGDLETDLKDKRLHVWHEHRSQYGGEKPDDDFVREGNWVLGENPEFLEWEDITPGGEVTFEIIE